MIRHSKDIAIYLKGEKCLHCGIKDLPRCCYAFHHRNPETKSGKLSGWLYSLNSHWDKIIPELIECDLLCMNCHTILHVIY